MKEKIRLNNVKSCIIGIQGSGKTQLAIYLAKNHFKRPIWYLMHLDDAKNLSNNVQVITAIKQNLAELNTVCEAAIKLGKEKKIDCVIIDEMDMFINNNSDLTKYPHINDLVINHRHYNLAVIGITRRPQDIPTKFFESCEHIFVFALPNSDNIDRKMGALDRNFPDMIQKLQKDNHNFIHKRIGEAPRLKQPIPINGSKDKGGFTNDEAPSKTNIADDESRDRPKK